MRILSATLLLFVAAGCARSLRPASYRLEAPDGNWQFDNVGRAQVDLGDWAVEVVESSIADASDPRLERLVLVITNTSSPQPLTVQSDSVFLVNGSRPISLGPAGLTVLGNGESLKLTYAPGLRAPLTQYPFKLEINARHSDFPSGMHVLRLWLY